MSRPNPDEFEFPSNDQNADQAAANNFKQPTNDPHAFQPDADLAKEREEFNGWLRKNEILHKPSILGYLRSRGFQEHDAENAFQHASLNSFAHLNSKGKKPEEIGRWLKKVSYHKSLDLRKKLDREAKKNELATLNGCLRNVRVERGELVEPLDDCSPPDEVIRAEELDLLWEAIKELRSSKPRAADALVLRYFRHLSAVEIARVMDVSPNAIYADLEKAKDYLGSRLQNR